MKKLMKKLILVCVVLFVASTSFATFWTGDAGFESYTVGLAPPTGAPDYWENYGTTPVVSTTQAHTGSKSVLLDTYNDNIGQTHALGLTEGSIDFSFYFDQVSNGTIYVFANQPSPVEAYIWLTFDYWGGIKEKIDGVWQANMCPDPGGRVALKVWHTVSIKFSNVTHTFDLWYDGVLIGQNRGYCDADGGTYTNNKVQRVFVNNPAQTTEKNVYIDDFSVTKAFNDCNDLINNGHRLSADACADCYIDFKDFAVLADKWGNSYSNDKFQDWDGALPGYYVASIKAVNNTNVNFSRLCMLTFNSDGTVTNKYWTWALSESVPTENVASDRMVGNAPEGAYQPPYPNHDEDKYVVGLNRAISPNADSNLVTLTGIYTWNKRHVDVNYANGSWEKWYITWEEPGNLYKMELYDASYIKSGTNFWLTSGLTEGTRDASANNVGWAFGSNSYGFTYARPSTEMFKDHLGVSLGYNTAGEPNVDVLKTQDDMPLVTNHAVLTDNGVCRTVYAGNGGLYVYMYYTSPVSNPGILARRVMYQTSHDFDQDGYIQDDGGHVMAGLQIIDNNGAYRGSVLTQVLFGTLSWVDARFWLDLYGTIQHNSVRCAVRPENGWLEEDFDEVAVGERPTGNWWFSQPIETGRGTVTAAQSYSSPHSLDMDHYTSAEWNLDGFMGRQRGLVKYKLYLPNPGDGTQNAMSYSQWGEPDDTTSLICLYLGSYEIVDVRGQVNLDGRITFDTWHDIELYFDHTRGATGEFDLYVDGIYSGTRPLGGSGVSTPSTRFGWILWYNSTLKRYLDDVYIGPGYTCEQWTKLRVANADMDGNCSVNFEDLKVLAEQWLKCNNPADSRCEP